MRKFLHLRVNVFKVLLFQKRFLIPYKMSALQHRKALYYKNQSVNSEAEISVVFSQIRIKCINTICGQEYKHLKLNLVVSKVTTEPYKIAGLLEWAEEIRISAYLLTLFSSALISEDTFIFTDLYQHGTLFYELQNVPTLSL